MSYRLRQRLIAAGFVAVAFIIASYSGVASVVAVPFSAVLLGWPLARFVILPARRQFIAEHASGASPSSRPSLAILLGAVIGIAAPAVLSQISDAATAAVIAQYVAAFGGSFFIASLSEIQ
jgi:hypothetical protein